GNAGADPGIDDEVLSESLGQRKPVPVAQAADGGKVGQCRHRAHLLLLWMESLVAGTQGYTPPPWRQNAVNRPTRFAHTIHRVSVYASRVGEQLSHRRAHRLYPVADAG